jgi:HD superfamily phosphohydrolase
LVIYDPLYGAFELPKSVLSIIGAPEFRRLSQIRLLNTLSPTLATLGEIRRYSHTLGVIYLETLWEKYSNPIYSREELDAFQVCIILHDIGTPPFGHLFEYLLNERGGWSHEEVIVDILKGRYAPENVSHQIFASQTLKIVKRLKTSNINIELVLSILQGEHPLSELIFGVLDYDNLDNVMRMAWALGIDNRKISILSFVKEIGVGTDKSLLFPKKSSSLVSKWMTLRKKVYDILVFDVMTVSSQAVLSKALLIGLDNNILDKTDWSLTDEELLKRLQGFRLTKDLINLQYLGELPKHIFTIQVSKSLTELGYSNRNRLVNVIERCAIENGIKHPIAYIFRDSGAFEKSLRFVDPKDNLVWEIGKKSKSTVIYLFSKNTKRENIKTVEKIVYAIYQVLNISISDIINFYFGDPENWSNGQHKLHL